MKKKKHRAGRIILRTILIILAVLIVLPALLYLPPVQNFARNQLENYAAENLGMRLTVERIRLGFPLRLGVRGAMAVLPEGDTLFRVGNLQVDAAVWPLLRGEVLARNFALEKAAVHLRDTATGLELKAGLGKLSLPTVRAQLKKQTAEIPDIVLSDADVFFIPPAPAPDTAAQDTVPLRWVIDVGNLAVSNVAFAMQSAVADTSRTAIAVRLPEGAVSGARVALENMAVGVASVRLSEGEAAFSTAPFTEKLPTVNLNDTVPMRQRPVPIDPARIRIGALDAGIDSLYYQGSTIRATVRELALREQSGLVLRHTEGRVAMDSVQARLEGFRLQTLRSSLSADALVGMTITEMAPATPVELKLSASLDATEILRLLPAAATPQTDAPPAALARPGGEAPSLADVLAGKTVILGTQIKGQLGDLQIDDLGASMPGNFNLSLSGGLRSVTDPSRMEGQLRLNGNLQELAFLKGMLPDTALRRRIAIPNHMLLQGNVRLTPGTYAPDIRLTVGEGFLAVKGRFSPETQRYGAEITAGAFPLCRFLPADSLGPLDLTLKAAGRGFDLMSANTAADLSLAIDRFGYNGYDYRDITLKAGLHAQRVKGELRSDSEALKLRFDIGGLLSAQRYEAGLKGRIERADLYRMRLTADTLAAALSLDLTASMVPGADPAGAVRRGTPADSIAAFTLNAALDTVRIELPGWTGNFRNAALEASSGRDGMHAGVRSGDIALDFDTRAPLDSLLGAAARLGETLPEQLRRLDLDMAGVGEQLPPLQLKAAAGRNNILHNFLAARGVDFSHIGLDAGVSPDQSFNADFTVNRLVTGGIRMDTITARLDQQGHRLGYALRLANAPGNLDNVGMICLSGEVVHNGMTLRAVQQDRAGETGFDFGLKADLSDSVARVTMSPLDPTLGFERWTVNPGNYISYDFAREEARADLNVSNGSRHFILKYAQWPGQGTGGIRIDIAGIDIGKTLSLFPGAPPVAGLFNTDLMVAFHEGSLAAEGSVGADSLFYNGRRVGDIGLDVNYRMDAAANHRGALKMRIDKQEVLTADGHYYTAPAGIAAGTQPGDSVSTALPAPSADPMQLTLRIPSLPLAVANAFLPEDTGELSGSLEADMTLAGSPEKFTANGGLQFKGAAFDVAMIGTKFTLSEERIPIESNLVSFNGFSIRGPKGNPLTVNGTIDMKDFSAIMADLAVNASNFQAVDVKRNSNSLVYGTAIVDLNATVRGPLDQLAVRGNLGLLYGTNVVYTMRDSSLELKNEQQDLVTFVSFLDSTAMNDAARARVVRNSGMDMLVNVSINDGVRASLYLSADGSNRVDLVGGGDLTYTMNRLGDTRLTGRYTLTGGTVLYNPPVISQKEFAINDGSYVEWNGDLADPYLDITATEALRTSVTTEESGTPRQVTFDIMILIRNKLDDLSITFDLAAPQDLSIQNQLTSLTAEQRSTQAMNMLIYNTYTGPGTVAKGNTSNPLNSFIEKELNSWARNNLKGVDLSFGIDSYDQMTESGESTRTDYSYRLSKNFFNNRVRAVIGGSVSTGGDPGTEMTDNLVNDISLEYMLNDRQNMYLKLFRFIGYESILEGEIVSTGIGFVISKKLYRLSDLFRFRASSDARVQMLQQKSERRSQILEKQEREREDAADGAADAQPAGNAPARGEENKTDE